MKRLILLLLIITPALLYAGVIMKKTGETIEDITIQTVSNNEIVYLQNGNEYTISKSDVSAILHDDGRFEEIKQQNNLMSVSDGTNYYAENEDYKEKEYNIVAWEKSGYDGIKVEYRVISKNQQQIGDFQYLGTTPFAYVTDNEARFVNNSPELFLPKSWRSIKNIMEVRPLIAENNPKIEFRLSKTGYKTIIVSPMVKIDVGGRLIILPLKKLKPLKENEQANYDISYSNNQNNNTYSDNNYSNSSTQNSDFGEFIDPATIEQSNNEYIEEPKQSEEPKQKASQETKRPRQDFAEEEPKKSEPKQRSSVEVLYGYLKIFPNELGEFNSEPKTIIAQINKQALHDYNTWRIPTNEELSLLRANGYVGDGQYMTSETRHGIVLLVTDGNEYKPVKDVPTQTEPQKPRASEPKIIKEPEDFVQEQKPKKSSTWVDLGLPSGTKWKRDNESDDYFTYYQAIADYDGNIPTIEQFAELRDKCKWTWENNGYRIEGPNGNTIFLPANGWKRCNGNIGNVGTNGYYMSSTIDRVDYSCYMSFSRETIEFYCGNKCIGRSVRLVTQ